MSRKVLTIDTTCVEDNLDDIPLNFCNLQKINTNNNSAFEQFVRQSPSNCESVKTSPKKDILGNTIIEKNPIHDTIHDRKLAFQNLRKLFKNQVCPCFKK